MQFKDCHLTTVCMFMTDQMTFSVVLNGTKKFLLLTSNSVKRQIETLDYNEAPQQGFPGTLGPI